jgi:hypothetical protein
VRDAAKKRTAAASSIMGCTRRHLIFYGTKGVTNPNQMHILLWTFMHKSDPDVSIDQSNNGSHDCGSCLDVLDDILKLLNSKVEQSRFAGLLLMLEECWAHRIISFVHHHGNNFSEESKKMVKEITNAVPPPPSICRTIHSRL